MNRFTIEHKKSVSLGTSRSALTCAITLAALTAASHQALAHARAGERVFPATLAVEDPGVADEITLPQISTLRHGDEGRETEFETEFSKRITPDFALSVGGNYIDGKEDDGWDNFSLGAKYQLFENDFHETLISAGLEWDIGNSGNDDIGEDYSTLTPTLYIGKGFGDLDDNFAALKPLAVTGSLGVSLPTDRFGEDGRNADTLEWGFTFQYSLPYMVKVQKADHAAPLANIVPLVEFQFETPLNGDDRETTGTINPGLIWSDHGYQIGAEAILPVNDASGDGVGARVQLHFYLDHIFPDTIGKPILGGGRAKPNDMAGMKM